MRVGRVDVGQRSETVRRANLSAIVRELHDARPPLALGARRPHRPDPQRDPRPGRRARRRRPRDREAFRAPGHAGPAVAARPARTRDGAVVLALEISVDSLAAAIVGLGGEVLETSASSAPAGDSSVDEIGRRPRRPGDDLRRRRSDRPSSAIGVAVAGVVRRRDGLVVDGAEPRLARRPARRATRPRVRRRPSRSPSRTRPTSAPSPSRAAAPPSARRRRSSSRARSASAAGSSSTASR